jgi:hypothetical protein
LLEIVWRHIFKYLTRIITHYSPTSNRQEDRLLLGCVHLNFSCIVLLPIILTLKEQMYCVLLCIYVIFVPPRYEFFTPITVAARSKARTVFTRSNTDLGTSWRWVVSFTPLPLYPRGKSHRYTLDTRLDVPQDRSRRRGEEKILDSTGTRIPTLRSLYRLRYPVS